MPGRAGHPSRTATRPGQPPGAKNPERGISEARRSAAPPVRCVGGIRFVAWFPTGGHGSDGEPYCAALCFAPLRWAVHSASARLQPRGGAIAERQRQPKVPRPQAAIACCHRVARCRLSRGVERSACFGPPGTAVASAQAGRMQQGACASGEWGELESCHDGLHFSHREASVVGEAKDAGVRVRQHHLWQPRFFFSAAAMIFSSPLFSVASHASFSCSQPKQARASPKARASTAPPVAASTKRCIMRAVTPVLLASGGCAAPRGAPNPLHSTSSLRTCGPIALSSCRCSTNVPPAALAVVRCKDLTGGSDASESHSLHAHFGPNR